MTNNTIEIIHTILTIQNSMSISVVQGETDRSLITYMHVTENDEICSAIPKKYFYCTTRFCTE